MKSTIAAALLGRRAGGPQRSRCDDHCHPVAESDHPPPERVASEPAPRAKRRRSGDACGLSLV